MATIPVLFTHYGDEWIRGSETLLLDLLRGLDKTRVQPVVWCNGAEMAAASEEAGYPTYRTPFEAYFDYDSPKPSLSRYRALIAQCRAICRTHGIRVLHANSANPVQWLVPAAFGARLPVLAHLHIDYLRRSRYVLLLHQATRIVGVSRQVTDGFIEDGMAPERLKVIYNGIDPSRLPPSSVDLRATLGIPAEATVIATAGSLIQRKGHDVLIRAFHSLPGSVTSHLIIGGDGDERSSLQALVGSLGIADRVHFLGHYPTMSDVYQAADIFALASRGDAFGLVLAEAGHFGCPVVATRVGGIPEVIANVETGLLVAPDNVPGLATALSRLIADPALRAKMGQAAKVRVTALFTVQQMARQFEESYETLAAIPPAELGWQQALHRARPYGSLLFRNRTPECRYAA
jgi:glycosyltransferase involved in cell wall biosynthesis